MTPFAALRCLRRRVACTTAFLAALALPAGFQQAAAQLSQEPADHHASAAPVHDVHDRLDAVRSGFPRAGAVEGNAATESGIRTTSSRASRERRLCRPTPGPSAPFSAQVGAGGTRAFFPTDSRKTPRPQRRLGVRSTFSDAPVRRVFFRRFWRGPLLTAAPALRDPLILPYEASTAEPCRERGYSTALSCLRGWPRKARP